jgi:hypothetical protein
MRHGDEELKIENYNIGYDEGYGDGYDDDDKDNGFEFMVSNFPEGKILYDVPVCEKCENYDCDCGYKCDIPQKFEDTPKEKPKEIPPAKKKAPQKRRRGAIRGENSSSSSSSSSSSDSDKPSAPLTSGDLLKLYMR